MSRRRRAVKRTTEPDPVYNSYEVSKFINKVMVSGKKSTARRIVYGAFDLFAKKIKTEDVLGAFKQAIQNAKPSLEVKTRRIGGANLQVPVEIPAERSESMAMKWIIGFAQTKAGRSMMEGLSQELADCFNNQGAAIKKKDDTHKMAEANKAFAHYKW